MSASIFTSRCGVTSAARNVPIAKTLTSTRKNQSGCQVNAQAVPASILLATDLRTVRRSDMQNFNACIMAASQQRLLEGTIGKRREHPLPACARIRELRLLLGKIQPLD
jgi:hypothetical protein